LHRRRVHSEALADNGITVLYVGRTSDNRQSSMTRSIVLHILCVLTVNVCSVITAKLFIDICESTNQHTTVDLDKINADRVMPDAAKVAKPAKALFSQPAQ